MTSQEGLRQHTYINAIFEPLLLERETENQEIKLKIKKPDR
jgi:hypothetical protein